MKNKQSEAEVVESLHNELKQMVNNLKSDQKKLKRLIEKSEKLESVLISALENAQTHYEGAIYNLEEELES